MNELKFTFKINKPEGKWRSFSTPTVDVKFKGKVVGNIDYNSPHLITLMVVKEDINEDGNPNCTWKRRYFGGQFKSLPEAKDYLNREIENILDLYKIHFLP